MAKTIIVKLRKREMLFAGAGTVDAFDLMRFRADDFCTHDGILQVRVDDGRWKVIAEFPVSNVVGCWYEDALAPETVSSSRNVDPQPDSFKRGA